MPPGNALVHASDEGLLERAGRGDRDAVGELFGRYKVLAYRVAHRLLGNEADSLDAVQDGFVKALTHLDGFQGRSSFKTWLLRVVSNAALDLGRARGRRDALSLDGLGPKQREEFEPVVVEAVGGDLDRVHLRKVLNEALEQLPPAQRQTFVLHAEAELSYREVADTLEISVGTVMSRLFYARQRLRAILDAWTKKA